MKTTDLIMTKEQALANYLQCNVEDVNDEGDNRFSAEGDEYLVLEDDEADEAAKDYIRESLWAFHANFIASHSRDRCLGGYEEYLQNIQEECCEGCNELIYAMIADFDHFVNDAISADGRGHFIAPYDFKEIEEGDYYIYRQ